MKFPRFWPVLADEIHVPLAGEVAWLLPDGPVPYWRGRITDLVYRVRATTEGAVPALVLSLPDWPDGVAVHIRPQFGRH